MSHSKKFIDVRIVIGMLLIVFSIAGVMYFLNQANHSTSMYVARHVLVPGQELTTEDLDVVGVRTPDAESLYLESNSLQPGLIVTRTVGVGELVPVSALSSHAATNMTSIVISLAQHLPAGAVTGSVVDLWSAMNNGSDVFGPPQVITRQVTIAEVTDNTDFMSTDQGTFVELIVPVDTVAAILDAQANHDALSVIPSVQTGPQATTVQSAPSQTLPAPNADSQTSQPATRQE